MWIAVAIAGYFLLAIAGTTDKYLLSGPISNPRVYSFFVGMFGAITFLLIPFGVLESPGVMLVLLALVAGVMRVLALFTLFSALERFEVSRIIPALGGALPIFTLLFVFLLSGQADALSGTNFLAFLLLVGGSIGVTLERNTRITVYSLLYALLAAFLFAAFFVFSKFVYDAQSFLSGLVWISLGSVAFSFIFLWSKEVRDALGNMFVKKRSNQYMSKKTGILFVGNQVIGGSAILLQSFAIALVPVGLLPFVNALEGVTYLFIFLITVFLSLYAPRVLKEKISSGVIVQKVIAIVAIGAGLIFLAV